MVTQSTRTWRARSCPPPLQTTLLDLVCVLSEITESEEETVETALALLASGDVQLTGSFKGYRPERLSPSLTLTV